MTTIDSITRSSLMSQKLPIHYYVIALHFGLKCLRDIEMDSIGYINSGKFTVDANNEVDLPAGFIDWIRVGTSNGQFIIPMGSNESYNNMANTDDTNNQIPYSQAGTYSFHGVDGLEWAAHTNSYGEHKGRYFGQSTRSRTDTFKVIRERNKLYMGPFLSEGDTVYMDYLGDRGPAVMSYVHPYGEGTVESYIIWMMSKYRRLGDEASAKQDYYREMKNMRARVHSMTKEEWIRIARANVIQSIK